MKNKKLIKVHCQRIIDLTICALINLNYYSKSEEYLYSFFFKYINQLKNESKSLDLIFLHIRNIQSMDEE